MAIGSVYEISEVGSKRIDATEAKINSLKDRIFHNWDDFDFKSFPVFVGGMKFSPMDSGELWNDFADSDWYVPKYLFVRDRDRSYLVYNFNAETDTKKNSAEFETALLLANDSRNNKIEGFSADFSVYDSTDEVSDFTHWKQKINAALDKINSVLYQKIVLSRMVDRKLKGTVPIAYALEKLEEKYPRCYILAYSRNNSVFFGASPEMLAKISAGYIEADALAGSIPRGASESEDKMLERELLTSVKNLNEQKAVVDFIVNAFSVFSEKVNFSKHPLIRKLSNIQHLWTPISAKLKKHEEVFSILKAIHPTPAICGAPWSAALGSIIEMEDHSRGLFTGSIGWFNFKGEGEFAVAIRSALIKDNYLHAFAGCGIVEGSDPELEFREAELKLKPILALFEHETADQPK